ncbi:MAG: transglycosylase SLT domain-containing protein [Gallionella sp.]|nr:transglycosylase SLT domain-containing protein [Gallionella sp.]MDD4960076.1 transglycosylase SLT domain-containing protein [Gallionella sp.]
MPFIRTLFSILLIACSMTTAHAELTLAFSQSLSSPLPPASLLASQSSTLSLISEQDLAKHDVWVRIRAGFSMRDLDSSLVAKHEQWYASRPEYVARMVERARRYLYYITLEVERRGMPSEIALLPMIESAFDPGAFSTASASGIWQFMPQTGKNFGMEQNWWYDGRRDVISATTGALDYLEKLHEMFGDWELALAAYNWGEGSVKRAQQNNQRKGLPINYGSLKMPDETRNYVPKLLAIKNIISNPASFGLVLQDIPNQPYFAAITTAKHIDLQLAAEFADISVEEFIALNPAHARPVILKSEDDLILLPVDRVEAFRVNLENYNKPLVSWQAYQPKQGERLDQLAPRFGLSVDRLRTVNGLSSNNISTQQTLLVPINGEEGEADSAFSAFNLHLAPSYSRVRTVEHTIGKHETIVSIARRYHVSAASLRTANKGRSFKAGQRIMIVKAPTRRKHVEASRRKRTHTKLAAK